MNVLINNMGKGFNALGLVFLALLWSLSSVPVQGQDAHEGLAHPESQEVDEHAGHDHDAEHEGVEEDAHVDHEEADEHAGHDHDAEHEAVEEDAHAGHDHGEDTDEGNGLVLTPEQKVRFGLAVRAAGPGRIHSEVSLPGEIVFNEDHVVHLVPRMEGIAREVNKSVGDAVSAGEVMAVIDSRELADAKSNFFAAKARKALFEKTHAREKALHDKQVSSEQDFLEAEQAMVEADIAFRSAQQKLQTLGIAEELIRGLESDQDAAITRYEIRSPIDGVVTEKHIATGESLEASTHIFTVVDTRSVWVNLTVYTKNLNAVHKGAEVKLEVDHSGVEGEGVVAMVTPFVEEATRSASARVVVDNADGRWVPGTFVTGFISSPDDERSVVVPRNAVQYLEGREVVFVEGPKGFEMVPVVKGKGNNTSVEIVSGLEPGTRYVAEGAFQLKATIITSSFDAHAGHGH